MAIFDKKGTSEQIQVALQPGLSSHSQGKPTAPQQETKKPPDQAAFFMR